MSSLIATPQSRASFPTKAYPAGIDFNTSKITNNLGTWRANVSATFRQGQAVMLNSVGEVVISDGTQVLGVSKWGKTNVVRTVIVDMPITFGVASATKNLLPNIVAAADVRVNSAVGGTGTAYALTTDFTINATNGTITQVSSGGINVLNPVYVTFDVYLTTQQVMLFQGSNFFNELDYVTRQNLNVAVIQAPAEIFTTEFDTAQVYTTTGATSNIYVNSSGLFTSASGTKLVGHCIQIPTSTYPYLGVEFFGNVGVNS